MADNTYIHISDLPTLTDVREQTWVAVEISGKEGKKVDLSTIQPGGSVQSDWNQDDSTQPDFIKNKPEIPSLEGYATESWVEGKNYLVSGDLEDIQETLDNHETAIGIVASDVDDVSAAVTAIDTQVGEINSAVNELSETVEDQGESIDALAESITAMSGDIADIQQELTGYAKQDDLDELSDIVDRHADAILDAQADINDISAAIKDIDEALSDYATQDYVQEAVSGKVDKEAGKGLSTNDYTDADMAVVDLAAEVIPDDADIDNKLVSQSTLNTALAGFAGYEVVNVDTSGIPAPTGTINPHIIYLTKDASVTGKDQFKEWIYDSQWELVGDTSMDLNGYATEQWVEDKNYLVSADLAPYAKADDLDELEQIVDDHEQAIIRNTSDISDVSAAVDDIDSALEDFATKEALDTGLATKLDTTAFSTVSGSFVTADSAHFMTSLEGSGELIVSSDIHYTGKSSIKVIDKSKLSLEADTVLSSYNTALIAGISNSAGFGSCFAQGQNNTSTGAFSLAQGLGNSADTMSFAQGLNNKAKNYSMTQGNSNSATNTSIAQGQSNNADNHSQAFGEGLIISNTGMAIGKFNNAIDEASFVIGNGTSNSNRNDLFIIKHDGTVSSTGDFIVDDKSLSSVFDTVCANSATWDAVSGMVDTDTFETATAELSDDINLVASSVADNIADINYLSGAISSLPVQVQSDWTEDDVTSPAYIQNKPAELSMSAGDGIGITETAGALVFEVTGNYADAEEVAGYIEELSAAIDETSAKVDVSAFNDAVDAINDNFDDVDADIAYVSAAVSSIPAQVQSNWTEEDTASPAYIQNKPDELDMSAGDGIGITEVDNTLTFSVTGNYADADEVADNIEALSAVIDETSAKLDVTAFNDAMNEIADNFDEVTENIAYVSAAVSSIPAQVQSDWEEIDTASPAYIQNKPAELSMSAGDGIGITEANNTLTFAITGDYATNTDLANKIDKVTSATSGNVAIFDANGTLDDSQFSTAKLVNLYAENGTTQAVRTYLSINKNTYNVNIGTEDLNSSTIILDRIDAYLMSGDEKTVVAQASASIPANASTNNPLVTTTDMAAAIANFGGFKVVSADQQGYPSVASADTRTVYLVKDTTVTGSDQYKEWIWNDADPQDPQSTSAWELVGDTSMDLNGYVQFPNSYTAGNLVQFGANDTIADAGSTVSDLTNVQSDWEQTNTAADDFIKNKPAPLELTGGTYIDITTASNTVTIDAKLSAISADLSLSTYANVQANWNETDNTSDAYIANKPAVLIPEASPAFAAPTKIVVVSAMPAAANIDPTTIYLVKENVSNS